MNKKNIKQSQENINDIASIIRFELSKLSNTQIKEELQKMNLKKEENSLRFSLFQMELKTREIKERFLKNSALKTI